METETLAVGSEVSTVEPPTPALKQAVSDEVSAQLAECGKEGSTEDDRVSCALELIDSLPKEVLEVCQPQTILLVDATCDNCEETKAKYADQIKDGKIKVLDSSSGEGKEIADTNGLPYTPTLAVIDCAGKVLAELTE